MGTFTTSLPDEVLQLLDQYSKQLKVPKNKFIETSLRTFFEHIKRTQYIKSYKQMAGDDDVLLMAEDGMEEYYRRIEDNDCKNQ